MATEPAATEQPSPEASPPRPDNPFEIAPPPETTVNQPAQPEGPLLIRRDGNPDVLDARGRTLGIHLALLVVMALCWIFFRPLLAKIYRSVLNEGLFSQLYRERQNGRLGLFLPNYLLFFATAGFFVYLVGQAFEWLPSDRPWVYWRQFAGVVAGYYLAKHIVLWLLGLLFPVREPVSKYSFLIMLFGIIIGMVLIPVNLLISYAPTSATQLMVYLGIGLVVLLYLLRAGRSFLLTASFLPVGALHFLLYICAVEIAPLLIAFRALVG